MSGRGSCSSSILSYYYLISLIRTHLMPIHLNTLKGHSTDVRSQVIPRSLPTSEMMDALVNRRIERWLCCVDNKMPACCHLRRLKYRALGTVSLMRPTCRIYIPPNLIITCRNKKEPFWNILLSLSKETIDGIIKLRIINGQ